MRNGFIFNYNKCVNCNACVAACILENGGGVHPRNIFTYNSEAENFLPVINISLACNHCESPVCMDACPASAISRDEFTNAVIIDEDKCLGCKYCQWNCPYDAPKYDIRKKIITKCNLCYNYLTEGGRPACSSACPTGALDFGKISDIPSVTDYSWFPDKNLLPAIEFTSSGKAQPLKVVPENIAYQVNLKPDKKLKNISGELSLIIFTFFSTISVAQIVSSFLKGKFPQKWMFFAILLISGLSSFFHLGRIIRAWRSVANIKNSPLSREIAAYIFYAVFSSLAVFMNRPVLMIVSGCAGLVFLLTIDSVYLFTDRKKSILLQNGQTFISALIIISFICGLTIPFVFIALIIIGLTFYNQKLKYSGSFDFTVRYMRLALLIVPGLSIILHHDHPDISLIIIFLTGELLGRILFYMDFNPLNIRTLIDEQTNIERNEKKIH